MQKIIIKTLLIFFYLVFTASPNLFSQQVVIHKEDVILKQIALKYFELSYTQINTKKKSPCDFVSSLDIKKSILSGFDAASKITDTKVRKEVITYIRSSPIMKPFLAYEFSIKLAFENFYNGRAIWDFSEEKLLRNALKNTTFWGPAPGIYGHQSYYIFKDNMVEFHFREDPENGDWKMQTSSYQILINDDRSVTLEIGLKKYFLIRYEGNDQPFMLQPFEEDYNDTFYETESECEA